MTVLNVLKKAKTPFFLLLFLGFFAWSVNWGYHQVVGAAQAPPTCVITDVGEAVDPPEVTVQVMNGGIVSGLAQQTRNYLVSAGFKVKGVGNVEEYIKQTTIVGTAENSPEVLLVMGYFPDAIARPDGRADHSVDVLVGPKYTQVPEPVTFIPVAGPVCLPALASSPSPSASAEPDPEPEPEPDPSESPK